MNIGLRVLACAFACAFSMLTIGVTTGLAPAPELRSSYGRPPLTPGPAPGGGGFASRLTVSPLRAGGLGGDGETVPAVRRYQVQAGDTLDAISARMRLRPDTLRWANPALQNNDPQVGQLLVVPPVDGVIHVVAPGETPNTLVGSYGVKLGDVLDSNGLRSVSQIQTGMRLLIPGGKPPAVAPMAGGGTISYRASDFDGFPWGWCTWYVAQRRDIPWGGDAWTWFGSAKAAGLQTGKTPKQGAIMVTWESYWYGHVAYVESVNPDGSWVVSEMNYKQWGAVDMRTIKPGSVPLIGFVY